MRTINMTLARPGQIMTEIRQLMVALNGQDKSSQIARDKAECLAISANRYVNLGMDLDKASKSGFHNKGKF